MCCWIISPFYDFCCFRCVTHCMSPLTSVQTDVLYIYYWQTSEDLGPIFEVHRNPRCEVRLVWTDLKSLTSFILYTNVSVSVFGNIALSVRYYHTYRLRPSTTHNKKFNHGTNYTESTWLTSNHRPYVKKIHLQIKKNKKNMFFYTFI